MSAQTFRLRSGDGLEIQLTDIGAAWMSCRVPVHGGGREVLLGHASPEDHLTQAGYLGAIVGRYANRIANASFTLDGRLHALAANEGEHQLHGGPDGFHRQRWQVASHTDDALELTLTSPDGDQGYPGALQLKATYRVAPPLTVHLDLEATTSAPTLVNLTSHAYFNLDGGDGRTSIRGHRLLIRGDRYLPVRPDLIPTGEQRLVKDSPFDFREPRYIGEALDLLRHAGALPQCHDHCWLIAPAQMRARLMARLWSGDGALGMDLCSDQPGLQFYAGEFLPRSADRAGRPYAPHAGLALEPQALPDSPHHPAWPQAVLNPGEVYRHRLSYRFFLA